MDLPGGLYPLNWVSTIRGEVHLIPPLRQQDVTRLAQGEPLDPAYLDELKERYWRDTQETLGPIEGVDANDLAQAGWGVIFAYGVDSAVKDALKDLLEHRKAQATKHHDHYYKEYTGPNAYRPNESKRAFLARHGASAGMPADPNKVPYYLLIVGDPESIPFSFQYMLDVEYAVGRLWFENEEGKPDLEAFRGYAASVVAAETGKVSLARQAVFFGVQNDDDRATTLSATRLVEPLVQELTQEHKDAGWTFRSHLRNSARRTDLIELLKGDTPALLFTASHGMGFQKDDPRLPKHQGALLCQDWPGPVRWRGQPIPPEFYFAADDLNKLGSDARIRGLMAFHFACYGAGTPRLDDFAHLKHLAALSERTCDQAA